MVHCRREWQTTQYFCLENPMKSMKRQNDRILKEEIHRLVGAQNATGDQWRNNSRKNEEMDMAPLQEILCYSDDIYVKEKPESGLSNFMADAIREFASQYSGETIDVGLMNFGGIRTDMPKGAVRVYDIYAISPFNNYLTIIQVKGSTLRRLFNRMAAGHLEALSGVRMKIDDKHLKECLVGGKPLDDNRTYTVATIDFLVTGGDGIDFGDGILFRGDTGVLLRDAIISILKQKMAAGETLNLKKDGRVVINYSKR